jgi:RsiW-degrading membrane proteinase PrsW (M82 family)
MVEPAGPTTSPRLLGGLVLILGLAALLCGPLAGGLFVLLSLDGRQADVVSVTIGLSVVILGLSFGTALAWAGYQDLKRCKDRPFQPAMRWFWICLVGLTLTLIIGQLIISVGRLAAVVVPLFHVLAIALPAIGILILAGHGLKGSSRTATRRQIIGEISLGAFGTTAVSITLEAVVGVTLLVVAIVVTPGGLAQVAGLRASLSDPSLLQDPQALVDWLLRPWILVPLILLFVIIGPLIEETMKGLGVPLLTLWRGEPPSPAQGWLWGLAVGAGFAITEGVFNGAAGLGFFAVIALLRAGATLMHMTAAGLTGMGWAGTLSTRRPWPLLRGYVAGVTLHGLWNGLTILIGISSIGLTIQPSIAGLGTVAGGVGMLVLVVAIVGVWVYVTRRVRGQSGWDGLSASGAVSSQK